MSPIIFLNFSNHPIDKFSEAQLRAIKKYDEIRELPFPQVPAMASHEDIQKLAEECICEIVKYHPDIVMCQGEFTLTYAVVCGLKKLGIICVSSCSERKSRETILEDGTILKESLFDFVQFREY